LQQQREILFVLGPVFDARDALPNIAAASP
jgi:hypothetical protein